MNYSLEKKEDNKATINIEISEDKFKEAIQTVYLQTRNRFSIPGFRKGKVPKKIIEMNYGEGIFYEDALNSLLPDAYEEAIEELELEPVGNPELDVDEIEKGKPITLKIEVAVKPEIKLGEYKNLELEKVEHKVTDEDVELELKSIQEMNGRIIDASDRETQDGDILTIDFEGYIDEEQFEGGTAEDQELTIGEDEFIPGFEEQLIGKKKEDEVEVKVNFPEDYAEESLKGKEAIFKVNIKEVKEKELPILDDEFAIDVSEFDTLDEYKESIREKLEKDAKEKEEMEMENKLIEHIVENTEMDIPEEMIENQIENEKRQFEHTMGMQGLNIEQYFEMTNTTMEDLEEQVTPVAEKKLKADLVLEAIEKKEDLDVTDEEVDAELEKMAAEHNQEDVEKFKEEMQGQDLQHIKLGIVREKTIELLVASTKWI